MKDVKIVIGANYGDEGKGLMTRHFVLEAQKQGSNPIVIFHNGTAQRGHTVDYNENFRHVYHHFCSGTAEGAHTFFAKDFLIHPMEFHREYQELVNKGIRPPRAYFDMGAMVITPFDMLVDHATMEHIARLNGEREFGTCGFGSWCAAEDRLPMGRTCYTARDFINKPIVDLLEEIWKDCLVILNKRGVDLERSQFSYLLKNRQIVIENFTYDWAFFLRHSAPADFNDLWETGDSFIFENGQGLGLDKNVDNDWHTTSNTGLANPVNMLMDKKDFYAEACYVTRSYLTRHGHGPMENWAPKEEINGTMFDKTNIRNEFQGDLCYGFIEDIDQANRIAKDLELIKNNPLFTHSMAVTHWNEFECKNDNTKYISDNPFAAEERR